jgi:hypothetical protein
MLDGIYFKISGRESNFQLISLFPIHAVFPFGKKHARVGPGSGVK